MIEISNTFILVWLVVLAIICIYLLYMSLTRNTESDNLRETIASLVRQNKKRDELINFLMERVETLTANINAISAPAADIVENDIISESAQQHPTDVIPEPNIVSADFTNSMNTHTDISIDDVLNSIHPEIPSVEGNILYNQPSTNSQPTNDVTAEPIQQHVLDTVIPNINIIQVEQYDSKNIIDLSSKTMPNINLDDVLSSVPSVFKDDDLISTILGADDSASQIGCNDLMEDHSNLPAEKLKLLGMNVKQLKQIAKDMNIKSRGNKTDLVENIWGKMQTCDNTSELLLTNLESTNDPSVNTDNETPREIVVEELPDDI